MTQKTSAIQAQLLPVDEVAALIEDGTTLLVAGDEALLLNLPKGKWIGGSIPYFMAKSGGTISREQVFVHRLPNEVTAIRIRSYDIEHLPQVAADAPDNGFSVLILPAGSDVHAEYARSAPDYEDMFLKPIIGWISGVHLDDLGQRTPKIFNGETGEMFDQQAIVLHAELPAELSANIGIVNLFNQGEGASFVFKETSFHAKNCLINGEEKNLSEYLESNQIDTRLPLVADYHGAMINVSFQGIDVDKQQVDFYAPVFDGIEYKLAEPVPEYVESFQSALPANLNNIVFSCNCILNFLYSELEGKRIDAFFGPITFGEVAYQLLNQTLVYLTLEEC